MKRLFKLVAPLILVGTGAALLHLKYHAAKRSGEFPTVVLISGDDPAFDAAMHNVLLLKRTSPEHRVATIKVLRYYSNGDPLLLKELTEHGGYVCGLSADKMTELKAALDALGAIVEIR